MFRLSPLGLKLLPNELAPMRRGCWSNKDYSTQTRASTWQLVSMSFESIIITTRITRLSAQVSSKHLANTARRQLPSGPKKKQRHLHEARQYPVVIEYSMPSLYIQSRQVDICEALMVIHDWVSITGKGSRSRTTEDDEVSEQST
ncbi:hypothetical protein A9K55_003302 [Cordyceps militaris]|uniref:Uncharacterized protein n=1 Tax=Cordyceps militaris TaxID=73501 RepID=A0A2H4S9G3_CORMI|nr:hypothetical protein A9K55_003302 [Cordyceps militaris]